MQASTLCEKKMFVCNFNFSKIASLIQGSTYYLKNCLNQRLLLASRQSLYAFTLKVSILNKSKGSNKLNRHFSKKRTPLGSEHKQYLAIIFIQKFFYSPQKYGQSEVKYTSFLFICLYEIKYLFGALQKKNVPHKMQKISKSLYISPYGWKSQNICVTNLDL